MNKEKEWRSHVKQQKLSGKSIKEYCEEHGLIHGSWHYYKDKYLGKKPCLSKFVEAEFLEDTPLVKCELVSQSGIRVIFEELPSSSWLRDIIS